MASNRCFLKKLDKKKELTQMKCNHQYALLSSTPEKEEKFLAAKKKVKIPIQIHSKYI